MKVKDDCHVCQVWLSDEQLDLNPWVGRWGACVNLAVFPLSTTASTNLAFSEGNLGSSLRAFPACSFFKPQRQLTSDGYTEIRDCSLIISTKKYKER